MKNTTRKEIHGRLNFKQVSMFIVLTIISLSLHARELNTFIERRPASVPEEEVMTVPSFDRPLLLTIFADDDAGVMSGMRGAVNDWQAREDYAKTWDLESSGLYNTPSTSDKRKWIMRNLLKYADKRLSGEVAKAEEGSTLHTVGQVEKSLRPKAEVAVSKYISFKFKARVLQGKAIMEIRNPWIECSTVVSAKGDVKVITKKDLKDMGVSSGVELTAKDTVWVAYVDKQISENIKARVSSTQNNQSLFNNDADKRVEMNAYFPIDL